MSVLVKLANQVTLWSGEASRLRIGGFVTALAPGHISVAGLSEFVKLGDRVEIDTVEGPVLGEVIRVDGSVVQIKCFEARLQAGIGARVIACGPHSVAPCQSWKGRALNALGIPIDGMGSLPLGPMRLSLDSLPPPPLRRAHVTEFIRTGVRAIDIFTPICAGQRIGIFAGSGVGKSTLLGMLKNISGFDAIVVALVGERGREVREFLEFGFEDRKPSVITIVATGDESAMARRLAPLTAMRVAEFFRDASEKVLLIIDSITRYAHALRDVALAAGELPVARGYTPSVFSDLPRLLERAGPGIDGGGSITAIISVLADGDDHNDPVADSIRSTLDGHIVLDRAVAESGRYPAIDVLTSVSRLSHVAWTKEQGALVQRLRGMISRFEDTRDLRLMGGYQSGMDPDLDQAVALAPKIYASLGQSPGDRSSQDAFLELSLALQSNAGP